MTWNIHKKLLLTGLNTAPAFDPCLIEPVCELEWDPTTGPDQALSAGKPSYKKRLYASIGLAVLAHLCLFALGSRVGISEIASSAPPTLMTFTFSFENAAPLPMANQAPSPAPHKPIPMTAPKPLLKPAINAIAPVKEEPKPEGVAEPPSLAPELSSASENAFIVPSVETAANRGSDSEGETASLTNGFANSFSSSPAVFQTAYRTGSGGAAQTPLIKADPNYAVNPPPEYPALARRRGYEGLVFLEVLVDRKGKVTNLKIAQSSGFVILDQAALQAVKKWLFKPAKQGDDPVDDRVKVPIRFRLK